MAYNTLESCCLILIGIPKNCHCAYFLLGKFWTALQAFKENRELVLATIFFNLKVKVQNRGKAVHDGHIIFAFAEYKFHRISQ